MKLRDVIYDLDRGVFVATMRSEYCDFPIATVDAEIERYLAAGWHLGSYRDDYRRRLDEGEADRLLANVKKVDPSSDPYENLDIEVVQTLPPAQRPKEFNTLFKAFVRELASSYDGEEFTRNPQAAYALDKMARYPKHLRLGGSDPDDEQEWEKLQAEFETMPYEEQRKWLRKVDRYPQLATLLRSPSPNVTSGPEGEVEVAADRTR